MDYIFAWNKGYVDLAEPGWIAMPLYRYPGDSQFYSGYWRITGGNSGGIEIRVFGHGDGLKPSKPLEHDEIPHNVQAAFVAVISEFLAIDSKELKPDFADFAADFLTKMFRNADYSFIPKTLPTLKIR